MGIVTSQWQTDSLTELESLIWATLGHAVVDANHHWSLPTIGSVDLNGPDVRVVVLRQIDRTWRRLVAFSDSRTDKVAQLQADPRTAWHFYDRRERIQLRLRGASVLEHNTDFARRLWEHVPEANRSNYQTMGAPGTTIPSPAHGHILAPGAVDKFAVIVTTVSHIDWLSLAPTGHRRARFDWLDGVWKGCWTVP